mgnify:CR=1 FL=1
MLANLIAFVRFWIALSLAVLGLTIGIPVSDLSNVRGEPFVIREEKKDCLPLGTEADVEISSRGASFEFVDHEMARAGGYGLRPVSRVMRGPGFDLLDHQMAHAGSYDLVPLPGIVAGPGFEFLDHEMAYAGGYSLCAVALAAR